MSAEAGAKLRLHAPGDEERKISWLELFYDLVYVTIVIQLGDFLSANVTPLGGLLFVLLFVPIWWSWTGMMFYFNRFVVDDLWHRLLVFAQMFAVAFMAVGVSAAFGAGDRTFALAYFAVRMILVLLYLRAWLHVKSARALIGRYASGFTVAASFWALSVLVPPPFRYGFWAAGLVLEFWVPLSAGSRRLQTLLPPDRPHLAERYGLFTIIVLGESFIKVVGTLAGQAPTSSVLLLMALGFGIVLCLWWLYFGLANSVAHWLEGRYAYLWIYSHLPVAVGITAVGVGLKKIVVLDPAAPIPAEYRWLLAGALALFLGSIALLGAVSRSPQSAVVPLGSLAGSVALLVVVLVGAYGGALPAWSSLALMLISCAAAAASGGLRSRSPASWPAT